MNKQDVHVCASMVGERPPYAVGQSTFDHEQQFRPPSATQAAEFVRRVVRVGRNDGRGCVILASLLLESIPYVARFSPVPDAHDHAAEDADWDQSMGWTVSG